MSRGRSAWTEIASPPALCRSVYAGLRRRGCSSERVFFLPESCCRVQKSPGFPSRVFDAHPVEFALVPHPSVPHQYDNVTEQIKGPLPPPTGCGSRQQLPFCLIVEPQRPSVLLHQFDFRSMADRLPFLRLVQHSSQSSQGAVPIAGRAWKSEFLAAIVGNLIQSYI